MQEAVDSETRPRGVLARIGICLLNIWQPGLGLVRLAHYRAGFGLIGGAAAAYAILLCLYAFGPQPDYRGYLAILVTALGTYLVLYILAIVLSWRRSDMLAPRHGWAWRWYGVVGAGLAVSALFLLLPDPRYRSFYGASRSMAPTFQAGDRVLADMRRDEPLKHGDLVIEKIGGVAYMRRVAGLPGDTIAMHNGVVILNGRPVAQRLIGLDGGATGPMPGPVRRLREQFPGELSPHSIYDAGLTPGDNTPEVKLGDGEYFLLGDNRDNSLDSRFDGDAAGPGIAPEERIKGRVLFRYWRKGVGLDNGKL